MKAAKGIELFPIFLAVAVAPFVVLPGFWEYSNLPKLVIIQTLSGMAFALSLFQKDFRTRLLNFWRDPIAIAPTLLVLWTWIRISWSIDSFHAYHTSLHYTGTLLVFLVIYLGRHSLTLADALKKIIPIAGALVSLIGFSQYFLGVSFIEQSVSPAATFLNKNVAAHFLLFSIPFTFSAYSRGGSHRILVWFSACSQVAYLLIARSEASLLSLGIASLGVIILRRRVFKSNKDWRLPEIIRLIIASFIISVLPPNSESRSLFSDIGAHLGWFNRDTSLVENWEIDRSPAGSIPLRISLWKNSFEIIKANPLFGVGVGSWNEYLPEAVRITKDTRCIDLDVLPNTPHNDYLQLVCELGLVGFILSAWFFIVLGIRIRRNWRFLNLAALVALAAMLLNAGVSNFIGLAQDTFHFAILLGIIVTQNNKAHQKTPLRFGSHIVSSVAILLSSSLITLLYYERVKSDILGRSLQTSFLLKDFEQVIEIGNQLGFDNPTSLDKRAMTLYAQALNNIGDPIAAIEAYETFLVEHPDHLLSNFQVAIVYQQIGKFEEAGKHLKIVSSVLPNDPRVNYQSGVLLVDQGLFEKASDHFKLMAENQQKQLESWFWIIQLSFVTEDYENTAKALIELQKIYPNFPPLVDWLRKIAADPKTRSKFQNVREMLKGIQ